MITGIYISENGDVQVIGDVKTFEGIINVMDGVKAELTRLEQQTLLKKFSLSDLEALAKLKKEEEKSKDS